jgi:hypothetical protein
VRAERVTATPSLDEHLGAGLHPDRVGGEQANDLDRRRVTQLQRGLPAAPGLASRKRRSDSVHGRRSSSTRASAGARGPSKAPARLR